MYSNFDAARTANFLTKSLMASFALLCSVLIVVLFYTIVVTERHSFYEKMTPNVCTEITNETQFDYESQARLVKDTPVSNCSGWQTKTMPFSQAMPEYTELSLDQPLSRLWLHYSYKVPADYNSKAGLAIYGTRVVGGIFAIYINDELLLTNEEAWYMQWNWPVYTELPMRYVKPGEAIDIKIAIPYRQATGYSIGSFYVGDVKELSKWNYWRNFFALHLPSYLSAIFVFFGVISLGLAFSGIDKKSNQLFFIVAVIYAISNMQFLYNIPDTRAVEYWYGSIVDSSISWFFALSTVYALRFTRAGLGWLSNLLILWALINTLITLPIWEWQAMGFLLQHYITMFLYVFALIVMGVVSYRERNYPLASITLCIVIYILGGLYDLTHVSAQTHPDQFYVYTYASTPLMFFFLISLQRKYISAHHAVVRANETLQLKLKEQEQLLQAQHNQIVEQSKTLAVHNERMRFKRDIHDGMGSMLNLALRTVDAHSKDEKISEVFKECLDDLQNIVLSLQVSETSINAVLGALRRRLEVRLYGTDTALEWQVEELPLIEWMDSSDALNVMRIVQEAISNVLKHAQASTICLAAADYSHAPEPYVEISITDNGIGYSPSVEPSVTKSAGQGLKNMDYRASALGARLIKAASPSGTRISLQLPLIKPSQD